MRTITAEMETLAMRDDYVVPSYSPKHRDRGTAVSIHVGLRRNG